MKKSKRFNVEVKKTLSIASIIAVLVSFNGCSKGVKNEYLSSEPGFIVEDSLLGDYKYTHVLDYSKLENIDSEKKVFLSLVKECNFDKFSDNDEMVTFFRNNLQIIWPSNMVFFERNFILSSKVIDPTWDIEINVLEYRVNNVVSYHVVSTKLTALKDLSLTYEHFNDVFNYHSTLDESEPRHLSEIKVGESISSEFIFDNRTGEILAFSQSGLGSDSSNVRNSDIGDIDEALKTCKELNLLEDNQVVGIREFNELEIELSSGLSK